MKTYTNDFRSEFYKRYNSKFKFKNITKIDKNYYFFCENNFSRFFRDLQPNSSILELGCGSGRLLNYLKQKQFANVCGIDISEEQVQIAVAKGCNAVVTDAMSFLKSKNNTYDAIIALDFIEHFQKDELIPLFSLISNALKIGGKLLIQTPNGKGIYPNRVIYGDLTHMTIFADESLTQLLQLFDFSKIEFHEPKPSKNTLNLIIRDCLWSIIKLLANIIRKIEGSKWEKIWTQNIICICNKN